MLPREDAERLLREGLRHFAPDWELAGPCTEVTIREPQHWMSGIGTFGAVLRHRRSGQMKVIGRRAGADPAATYHRGVSYLVLEAFAERNTDPLRRYLNEIGVLAATASPFTRFVPARSS